MGVDQDGHIIILYLSSDQVYKFQLSWMPLRLIWTLHWIILLTYFSTPLTYLEPDGLAGCPVFLIKHAYKYFLVYQV